MTVIVQLLLAGIVPPDNCTPAEPIAKAAPRLLNNEPLQLFVVVRSDTVIAPGVVGNVSVKVALVSAIGLLLSSTICKVDTPVLGKIGLVKNDLVIVGGVITVILAVAAVPFDDADGPVIVKSPALIVLFLRPVVVPVTVAVTVQDPSAGIVPPVMATVVPLAVLVPTQVPPGNDEVKPAGRVSVNAAPVIAAAVGLLNVIVSVAVALSGIVATLKALLILGLATFNVSLVATTLLPMLDVTAPAAIVLV